MNIVLWLAQGILAFAFVTSGRINAFALGVEPRLTPLAAVRPAAIMVLAIGYHLTRGELSAVIVAWGRRSALRA